MPSLAERLAKLKAHVDQALDQRLPVPEVHPTRLHAAMRYGALNGGKRLRPALIYTTGEALGLAWARLDVVACAVELIHAYSLVHDDLPAMDDDDLRRGQPTCHRAFDEATAILAGDALQSLAFYILAHDRTLDVADSVRVRLLETLAQAAGSRGMAGGQAIDLAAVGQPLTLAELEAMHIHKTGALIRASINMAALCQPDLEAETFTRLDDFAKRIGLAFQIQDDLLNVEGNPELTGKSIGTDRLHNKPTYPALLGLEAAKTEARLLLEAALAAIRPLSARADSLRALAAYLITRPG